MDKRSNAFGAFRLPNFTLYFLGQLVSNTGTWFQNLAISLIVLQATGSASALALVTVSQFGPIALFASLAGRLADSIRPRTVLLATSIVASLVTIGLAIAVSGEQLNLPLVYGLIAVAGSVHAFERVAAQAIIYELVGSTLLQNAVVLSTIYVSVGRSIGPGIAGLSFVAFGPSVCLLVNGASYVGVFVALLCIRPRSLFARPRPEGTRVSSWETISRLRFNRPLMILLIVNVVVTIAAMNMNVVLTAVVAMTFEGDAAALGITHTLNAVGAVIGGLILARFRTVKVSMLIPACLVFGGVLAVNAATPSLTLFLVVAPLLGLGIGFYQAVLNTAAQGASAPHEIGRTMSLVTLGNVGVAPIGALFAGALIDASSGQAALAVGAASCIACAALVYFAVARPQRKERLLGASAAPLVQGVTEK